MDFAQLVKEEDFLRMVQLEPPDGFDLGPILEGVKDLTADAFNVVDSPLGKPLMNPMALCHRLQDEFGTPAVMHFTCRDRNLIEIKADLMAARALDINSVLALTGDRAGARPVFELSSLELIRLIHGMNAKGANFYIGCGTNLNADLKAEVKRVTDKIETGADFVMAQPCYDPGTIGKFAGAIDRPVFVGLLAFYDRTQAEEFNKQSPGAFPMSIFEEDLDETYVRMMGEIKEAGAKGVVIMPFGNFEKAKALIQS